MEGVRRPGAPRSRRRRHPARIRAPACESRETMTEPRYTAEDLKKLPLRAIVAFAARCARRVEDLALPPDGPAEKDTIHSAIAEALRVAEDFARGLPCPTLESAVRAAEVGKAAARGDLLREHAYAAAVWAAHAAATAAHGLALREEPPERRLVTGDPPPPLFPHLPDLSADWAAR